MDPNECIRCSQIITDWGKIVLCILLFIGGLGVYFHGWLSSRLVFFDSKGDGSNKGSAKRLIYPLILVAVLGGLTPWIITYSNQDIRGCLFNPENSGYIRSYVADAWKFIMPVIGSGVSIITCMVLSIIFYFVFGFITLLGWKVGQFIAIRRINHG